MLRALTAVVLLVTALAACGGGGDEDKDEPRDTRRGPSLAEWRLEVRNACREHSERLMESVNRLPGTRRQARRFARRMLRRERRFLVELRGSDAPASDRLGFREAVRDRIRSVDAQLKGRRGDARRRAASAFEAFEDMNLVDCAAHGAYGLPDGASYALERERGCRRKLGGLRRAAARVRKLPPGQAKLQAGQAFARRIREFGRRNPLEGAVPPAAEDVERVAFREIRRLADAFTDLLNAAERGDRPAFDRARKRFLRSAIRGGTAWRVLNIPSCEALYNLRID